MSTAVLENGESQATLKDLARKIAVAIKRLPDYIVVENSGGQLCVTVNKSEVQKGGLSYHQNDRRVGACTTNPACTYSVSIKASSNQGADDIATITYTDTFPILREGVKTGTESERLVINVTTTHGQSQALFSLADTIRTLPKTTPDDVAIVLSFLEKAVTQHQESERKREEAVDSQQAKTAAAVRAQLDRLV